MNSLAVKLMGAFAAVVLVGLAVVTIVANRATAQEFEHFMFRGQMVAAQDMQAALADHYARNGSWSGVQQLLTGSGMGMMGGMPMMHGMMSMMGSSRLRVVDARTRQVVGDTARTDIGRTVSQQEWEAGLPIVVRGRTVGVLLVQGMAMTSTGLSARMSPQIGPLQAEFLGRVNRAILLAALAAGSVALILGGLLVRQITAPLGELVRAAGRIASGDLEARVAIASSDELSQVGAAFNQMAASLARQEQLRRNLMADIAHELRTPISVIQGQVEALLDSVFPLTPDALDPIHSNALLLSRLVEDLRTLAHAEAGQLDLDRGPVALAEVVEDLFDGLRSQAEVKGVALQADVPRDLPPVDADPQRLRQILLNLLSNALRHTPPGGQVTVRARVEGQEVAIAVRDTGMGIPAEHLPHLFERFYRVDKSRSRAGGGSGIGLTIARHLVEAHGGRIWATSPGPGQGSTFAFTLPRAARSSELSSRRAER